MNADEVQTVLKNCKDVLEMVQDDDTVEGYAAEDYLDEAATNIESAMVDIARGRQGRGGTKHSGSL